ncbi:hypothetical protein [Nostoc sp. MG11]|uniref:hypothetical protein n=1 Tax=Nostoc sp. MG11 TaxID=2721166 RepID=UPI0018690BB5|nr:hypothetical protein [Nostoc sp. MG11]
MLITSEIYLLIGCFQLNFAAWGINLGDFSGMTQPSLDIQVRAINYSSMVA